jgi:transcriptional regulator of NAD metabolism
MELDKFINNLFEDKLDLDELERLTITNYNNHGKINFYYFIKEYQLDKFININVLKKIYELGFDYSINITYYYIEFGKNTQILNWFIEEGFFSKSNDLVQVICIYTNYFFLKYILDFKFNHDDIYFNGITKYKSIEELIQIDYIKIIQDSNFLTNSNSLTYSFNPNYILYDLIFLQKIYFEYDSFDNIDNNLGDIRIIKLLNEFIEHGYKIKNNIIFYIICWHLSNIIDKNNTNQDLDSINKLIQSDEFKKYLEKDYLNITENDINFYFESIVLYNKIKKKEIIEYLSLEINYNVSIKLPIFIKTL